MKVAGGTETVTVEAGAEAIQTESGELSKTIPQVDVSELPYASLNPYQLAVSLPGVTTVASRDDMTNGQSFSVNGLRPRSNNFLIDGFDNNDNGIMGQAFQPNNLESVQEVSVLTNSYNAEFGRGGGSVSNLTFRSGSHNFHGAAWEQYSGSDLNAVSAEEAMSGPDTAWSVRQQHLRLPLGWSDQEEQALLLWNRPVEPLLWRAVLCLAAYPAHSLRTFDATVDRIQFQCGSFPGGARQSPCPYC